MTFSAYYECRIINFVGQSCSHGDLRLRGGRSQLEGRVEVCRYGLWGTICDSGWDSRDAGVVCRQLGYAYEGKSQLLLSFVSIILVFLGAIARHNAYYGRGYVSIRMSSVGCTGTETRLVNCYFSTYISYYCDHYDDAGVTCLSAVTNNTVLERSKLDDENYFWSTLPHVMPSLSLFTH